LPSERTIFVMGRTKDGMDRRKERTKYGTEDGTEAAMDKAKNNASGAA